MKLKNKTTGHDIAIYKISFPAALRLGSNLYLSWLSWADHKAEIEKKQKRINEILTENGGFSITNGSPLKIQCDSGTIMMISLAITDIIIEKQ